MTPFLKPEIHFPRPIIFGTRSGSLWSPLSRTLPGCRNAWHMLFVQNLLPPPKQAIVLIRRSAILTWKSLKGPSANVDLACQQRCMDWPRWVIHATPKSCPSSVKCLKKGYGCPVAWYKNKRQSVITLTREDNWSELPSTCWGSWLRRRGPTRLYACRDTVACFSTIGGAPRPAPPCLCCGAYPCSNHRTYWPVQCGRLWRWKNKGRSSGYCGFNCNWSHAVYHDLHQGERSCASGCWTHCQYATSIRWISGYTGNLGFYPLSMKITWSSIAGRAWGVLGTS